MLDLDTNFAPDPPDRWIMALVAYALAVVLIVIGVWLVY